MTASMEGTGCLGQNAWLNLINKKHYYKFSYKLHVLIWLKYQSHGEHYEFLLDNLGDVDTFLLCEQNNINEIR